MKIAIMVIILSATILDATRDAWSQRSLGVSWAEWHLVKWAAFYPALAILSLEYLGIAYSVALSLACVGIWTLFYKQSNPIIGNRHLMDFARLLAVVVLFMSAIYVAVKVIDVLS